MTNYNHIYQSNYDKIKNIWNFKSNGRSLTELTYLDIKGKCIFLPYEMKNKINNYLEITA